MCVKVDQEYINLNFLTQLNFHHSMFKILPETKNIGNY